MISFRPPDLLNLTEDLIVGDFLSSGIIFLSLISFCLLSYFVFEISNRSLDYNLIDEVSSNVFRGLHNLRWL